MRGVQWDSRGGLRCGDCGAFEIDLLEDGTARCRSCGRASVPRAPRRFAGVVRMALAISGLLLVLIVVEALVSWFYTAAGTGSFLRTFSLLVFFTGITALALAGLGATPGRVALGTQRMDRLGRMYPVQDPATMETASPNVEAQSRSEPGAAGIFLLLGLGIILIFVGFTFGVA